MTLFRLFERLLEPTALPPDAPPPAGLGAFYWHYARQARWLVVALFFAGFMVATLDSMIPVFIGRVVTLVSSHEPGTLLAVTLTHQAKGFTKTVLVRVVHATQLSGGFLVGGTFTAPLTYQEMTTLVM